MKKTYYLAAYLIPVSTLASLLGRGVETYTTVIVSFLVIPIIELVLTEDKVNLSSEEEQLATKSKFYDFLLYSMVPIQYFLIFLLAYKVSHLDYTTSEFIGLILAMGVSCGVVGINVGHELGHRVKKSEQFMAKLLLATSWYQHFFVEHNKGHHRYVSTDEDPASAHLNETVYGFWFRSIIGCFFSALRISKKEVLNWKLYEFGITIVIYFTFGFKATLAFIFSAFIGILLLETVNYIEHYGLRRIKNSSGRYEKVTPIHSWNSDHPLGRLVLFNLSRHSDHHANVNRKYQLLRTFKNESPQLPTGYSGMTLLALIPPLWFLVMNKRVQGLNREGVIK